MDAGGVVTDRSADFRLERCTKSEVAPDTETHDADFPWRHLGVFRKPVQTGTAIGIEMCDRRLGRVFEATGASGVIEWHHCSRRFDAAINFRSRDNESIPGQPYTSA